MRGEFSVCQFFEDGSYEYVSRFVTAKEAFDTFLRYTNTVGSRLGTTKKVIITDGGDCINVEWVFGKDINLRTKAGDNNERL